MQYGDPDVEYLRLGIISSPKEIYMVLHGSESVSH